MVIYLEEFLNFLSDFLKIQLTHLFFRSMLFRLHVIGLFPLLFLWLISSFRPLWSKKILEVMSILLNVLRSALLPRMWSVLETVPCALEKKVYSEFFRWNVLKMAIKSNFSTASLRSSVALLAFCPEDLAIDVSGVLMSPTVIVFPPISPFLSVNICHRCLGAPICWAYMFTIVISSSWMVPLTMK